MVRTLLIIFVSALAIGAACLAAALSMGPFRPNWDFDREKGWTNNGKGPRETRDFAWPGGDRLEVGLPGKVTYSQGTPVKLTISGPKDILDNLQIENGEIDLRDGRWSWRDRDGVDISLTAPDVRRFEISGAGEFRIENYDQPSLDLDLSGAGAVEVSGRAGRVNLVHSGVGESNLANLVVQDARVRLSGVGGAKLAPTGVADISISGVGSVQLLSKPAQLTKSVSGVGSIDEP